MTRLANNILDMARLDAGAVTLKLDWYPMEEIVGGVMTRMHSRLEGRRIDIDLPQDLPLVTLDAVLIEQVLVNLIENALKYTPPASPIEISAHAAREQLVVTVADRGPGIPAGLEERLFEKFYRLTPEGAQSGVGLGLTICKAIVEAHGGWISVENRPEGGAKFCFTLPLQGSPPEIDPEPGRGDI